MEGIIFIDGSFYKLGVKGKVFRQVNGGWVLSSKTPRQLKTHCAIMKMSTKASIRG